MKITFQNHGLQETEKQMVERPRAEKQGRADMAYRAAFLRGNDAGWIQEMQNNREKGKTMADIAQEAGNVDVGIRQDYMTVLSNTMSEEDYAKMQEEGFDFSEMTPEEAVTILDKIKAELARSGQYIAGYTDDLDMDTLAAAVGSDTLARAITSSFQSADVPLTQENIDSVKRAWDMAAQLEAPGEGASYYMIDNGLAPEIWDFYLAQSSGAHSVNTGAPRYYAEEIQGYYTQSAGIGMQEGMQGQIDKVITDAGLTVDAETRECAQWLMDKGLPLTGENLVRLQEIWEVSFPVEEEAFAKAAAEAIAQGKNPMHANLAKEENVYKKAADMAERFWAGVEADWDSKDITARRQLEEIRLRMTAEVNIKLVKSGFAIDTAPMEALLEALKKVEAELAQSYFPEDEAAVEKYGLYRQTNQVARELPKLPAQVLGSWSIREAQDTVAQFYQEGKALQETYDKAQESYEALMTAPRADMGDSIKKAFANVDDILDDLQMVVNEENRRAVRILGYNRMELTVENIEHVKEMDEQVQSVVAQMTPAATLKMIRDGKNPLDMSFAQLQEYFDSLSEEFETNADSYSRFLYQLEQNQEITPAERDAYIGVYRMLRQLEKTDGAAVGAVANTGTELQFANLLAAVRSNRFRHMDVKVTDETGLISELVQNGSSISQQITEGIAAAKQMLESVTQDEDTAAQYRKMELEQLRTAAAADEACYALLEQSGMAESADNLLAANGLIRDMTAPFKKWKDKAGVYGAEMDAQETLKTLDELVGVEEESAFAKQYKEGLEELGAQVEEVTLEKAESSMDVRELQLIHKQISVAASLGEHTADSREYILPMYIGEELGKVHLTLENGVGEKGTIAILVDYGESTHVEAHLQLQGEKISGFLVGNTSEEVTKLQNTVDIFHELLKNESMDLALGSLSIVNNTNTANSVNSAADVNSVNNIGRVAAVNRNAAGEVSEEAVVPTKELYHVARMFLKAIKG